ncbi:Outer membrane protein OmpA [Bradyrhizobium erythrophlei]|nr:Outer membrane protein OmpA [Bradyrhizobium erythrophlei]
MTSGDFIVSDKAMIRGLPTLLVLLLAAPSLAAAQTISFGDAAATLGKSCGADLDANCRGVNLDSNRTKDCLYKNQDTMSAQCKADYPGALDAIQKHIAARANVGRQCEYEIVKKCSGKAKEAAKSIACLLGISNLTARCNQAIGDAGYKAESDFVTQLGGLETPPDLNLVTLRQQTAERSKSRGKNEPPPQKRPPIAPELTKLPGFSVDIQFDTDTPIVRPESYQTIGRIADALVNSTLLPYEFLIVGHIESTGRRDNNVLLSQRRADAVRDILVNTFKISSKRLQAVGLGEEQLLDPARPNAPVNNLTQIMTVAKMPEQSEQPKAAASKGSASAAKKSAKKRQ